MVIAVLIVLGLCFGSFVNALVWRLHMKESHYKPHGTQGTRRAPTKARPPESLSRPRSSLIKTRIAWLNVWPKVVRHDGGKSKDALSIVHGRSMCPNCKHELGGLDLIPVLSWVWLQGKCRYCHQPISVQYPLVELLTVLLFVISYICWPRLLTGSEAIAFGLWLVLLVGLIALTVYDIRWKLLPTRLIYPLDAVALVLAGVEAVRSPHPLKAVLTTALGAVIGGGIFYLLFQVSSGKWIGGGDVRLGWLLGIIVGTPVNSLMVIFIAAILGSLVSVPLLALKRLERHSTIPFGPFLIMATFLVTLWGSQILQWYERTFLRV